MREEEDGSETYFARDGRQAYFVKVGAQVEKYQAMASAGLTPPVLAVGQLEDGTRVFVQTYIPGRKPSRKDYQAYLEQVAAFIYRTHHASGVRRVLLPARSERYQQVASESLALLQVRWERYKAQAPTVAEFVDESLSCLRRQVERFTGSRLVVSHNDSGNPPAGVQTTKKSAIRK